MSLYRNQFLRSKQRALLLSVQEKLRVVGILKTVGITPEHMIIYVYFGARPISDGGEYGQATGLSIVQVLRNK